MAETHDATVASDVKMPLNEKSKLLCKLKGSIHFEKILTASSAYSDNLRGPSTLALPSWLVQEHGDKLRKSVNLRSESSTKAWPVTLSVFFKSAALRQVKFAGGWKAFATFNGLLEGDSLIFSLTGIAEFEVYVFPGTGNPKGCPNSQAPRKCSNGSGLSRKKAKQSNECRVEQLAAEGSIEGTAKLNGLIAKKETVEEERAVFASGQSPTSGSLSSYSKDLHLPESENVRGSSSECQLDSHNGQKLPAVDHDKLMMPSFDTGDVPAVQHTDARMDTDNQYQELTLQKITRNFPLSAFLKQLTASNFSYRREAAEEGGGTACMEIPVVFWRTYASRLHALVKLKGIREWSQVRTVACLPILQGDQTWRLYLRAGWREFADANDLQAGQVLEFTLTADSFFVVRRVNNL